MKKYILLTTFIVLLWTTGAYGDTPTSCGTFGSAASGCSYCFTASGRPYENDGISSSDRWTNTSTNQWQYLWVGAGKFAVGITELNGSSWNQSDTLANMYEIPLVSGTASNGIPYIFYYPSESSTWIRTKSGQFFRFVDHGSVTNRNTPLFMVSYSLQVTPQTPNGAYGNTVAHKQCSFIYGRWCGDGVLDSDKSEQCDNGTNNGPNGTCSSTCQNQTIATCNNLTVTPTSVTNGGTVTYTCSGTNATSFSIIARRPDGSIITSSTSAAGSIILPASPAGNYTVSCFINGQVSTPTSCQKTVTNTVPVASCDNLTVTPTSVTNGGTVTYTCSGTNVTSYSIIAERPDGSTLSSSTSSSGSIILPTSPAGTYAVKCFVNGQVSTPASCQKTVTNTVVNEPVCTGLTITPSSVTNGGNVTYTCAGNNVTSYSVVLKRPDGSTVQTLTSPTGTLTVPASPDGVYTASCFVNGQTTTPTVCQKTVTNNTTTNPVCTGLTITPTSLTDGGNVNYTCTGTDVSTFSVVFSKPDGTTLQSFSSPTGTVTVPTTPTGTYTARCYVNGHTSTPTICEKTLTNNGTSVTPTILITKTDANSADLDGNIGGNDSQTVYSGGNAIFRIRVTNTGTEDLKNIVLTDAIAPNCAGGVTLPSTFPSTWSSFTTSGSGNHSDALLQPGEYFEYICDRGNTTSNYTNVARVDAQGNISNTPVLDDDPSVVVIQPVTTTCTELSVTTSGNTVNYSCTGSGNITGYSILQNGAQISTSASGSVNITNGTHTFTCYVNNSITSASCQKTVTINPTAPQIQVIKDDNDDHDDAQLIQNGGSAQFTVVVKNTGSEALDTVTLSDPYAPECNRNSAETLNSIVNVGNRDARLDPGESFSYICIRPNVAQNTFPNNENRICVNGRGITSGIAVNSCDISRVNFGTTPSLCQNIQVTQNGNQTNVSCSPNGGYKLFVLQGQQVVNTLQSPTGQFTFGLNDGTYKVVCLRDGEQTVQPNCQKTIIINPKQDYCTLDSTVKYGGAPLRTQLSCSSQTYAQCMIRIDKDGKPWRSVANCHADIIFTEKGIYDATCIIGDAETQSCRTRVQVDIMTIIQTGPFMPILLLTSIGLAGYITYRRRKIV